MKKANIVLIGLMGCGKTTIALELAKRLNREVVDIDQYLEKKYNMTIPEMFDISENYFRERETICCEDVSRYQNVIISTGGGVIKNPHNIDVLKETGVIIYIDRPTQYIIEDVNIAHRPLLKDGPDKLFELHKERHSSYLNMCDVHIINDGSLEDVLTKVIECIK